MTDIIISLVALCTRLTYDDLDKIRHIQEVIGTTEYTAKMGTYKRVTRGYIVRYYDGTVVEWETNAYATEAYSNWQRHFPRRYRSMFAYLAGTVIKDSDDPEMVVSYAGRPVNTDTLPLDYIIRDEVALPTVEKVELTRKDQWTRTFHVVLSDGRREIMDYLSEHQFTVALQLYDQFVGLPFAEARKLLAAAAN